MNNRGIDEGALARAPICLAARRMPHPMHTSIT